MEAAYDVMAPVHESAARDQALAALRRDAPIQWDPENAWWLLTRHADIREVSCQPELFSSEPQGPWHVFEHRFSMQAMDGKAHLRHRNIVSRAFTPRMVSMLSQRAVRYADEAIDALIEVVDLFIQKRHENPVYGPYLSEDEALCIVTEMMVAMGFGGTIDFIGDIWLPMSVEDAHAVVDPVATCADLVEKVSEQGNAYGIGNVDCFTEDLTEDDVVRFEVLRLTGPREHYFDVDIMERCIPGYDD